MRILVTYGSPHGGAAGIARVIADELGAAGHRVDVHDAADVHDIGCWDAVVVGGALYATLWARRARRFVERFEDELEHMPVWLFSSGPLDGSASETTIPPTRMTERLVRRIGARGHVTFGGRLAPDAKGFPASAMAKTHAGDWRDMDAARAWARTIDDALRALPALPVRPRSPSTRGARGVLTGLTSIAAVVAVDGALRMLARADGPSWGPWSGSVTLDGVGVSGGVALSLVLGVLVGAPNLIASVGLLRRARWSERLAVVGGLTTSAWSAMALAVFPDLHGPRSVLLGLGLVTMALASWAARVRSNAVRARASAGPDASTDVHAHTLGTTDQHSSTVT